MQLVIQQMDGAAEPLFCVRNDGKSTKPVSLPDPSSYPVRGYDGKRLLKELTWYLEHYLEFPVGADAKRAEAVLDTLKAWGGEVFDTLFTQKAYAWYSEARRDLDALEIKIESASPAALSWPWEALYSGDDGYLAQLCCMKRQPPGLDVPLWKVPERTEELHILFIVSHPDTENKVGYHNLEREVVRYVREKGYAVKVDVLRPPTFDNLRNVLQERPGYYHIVHFDGHGRYVHALSVGDAKNGGTAQSGGKAGGESVAIPSVSGGPAKYKGMEGQLIFETDGAIADAVDAETLGQLLTQCGVSMMVLNACQSAMIDGSAVDPFASVAARLLKAGIPSVIAMGYSLYVSGAKHYVPAFYKTLFQDGRPGAAMRAGRQAMFAHPERPCFYGKTPLRDWIVPELYQQIPAGMRLLPSVGQAAARRETFPKELRVIGDYDLIGRGKEIHDLERILQRNRQAGILIHGMVGEGKTTLVKGFLHWYRDTGGLREDDGTDCQVFWFSFQDIHSVDAVFHPLADALPGETARTLDREDLLDALTDALKCRRVFMVWDNFESASGIPGTKVAAFLQEADRQTLKRFLYRLRGGKTRVFITSRTNEDWFSIQECARLQTLSGLEDGDLWDYCAAVVQDLEITVNREDKSMEALLQKLGGNPLALRAILLRLGEGRNAMDLLKNLDADFVGAAGDNGTEQMEKALRVLWSGMDPALSPVLQVIGLHKHYANADWVFSILWQLDDSTDPDSPEAKAIHDCVTRCFQILENAGLCLHERRLLYRLHPALRSVLAKAHPAPEDIKRWFVMYLTYVEEHIHDDVTQSVAVFDIHEANFLRAKTLAEELEMREADLGLTFGLAQYASNTSRNALAVAWNTELAEKAHRYGDYDKENRAYRLLATYTMDPEQEQYWSQKATDMWNGDEELPAEAYYTRGNNAEGLDNFPAAEDNYRCALAIWEQNGDPRAVPLYGQLGDLAKQQGNLDAAGEWFQKLWQKARENGQGQMDMQAAASRMLGDIAAVRGYVKEAVKLYQEALSIYQRLQEPLNIADTLYNMGDLLNDIGAYDSAKECMMESVRIAEHIGNNFLVAANYNLLGLLCEKQNDFTSAKLWFAKALSKFENQGDEENAAITRYNLERATTLAAAQGSI